MLRPQLYYRWIPSPIGQLFATSDGKRITAIGFSSDPPACDPEPSWQEDHLVFQALNDQLESYFSGQLRVFTLPLAPAGTPFQMKVWQCLRQIPYGQTLSYGQVADRIGKPRASRAVGAACGQNPLSIVVPCHRVVGHTGKLVGFGGGLETKQKLLTLEQHQQVPAVSLS